MIDLQATDVRTFLPSQDFALSQAFYEALGCEREWSDDNLALFKLGPSRFYLQHGYAKEWAENTMLHVPCRTLPRASAPSAHCWTPAATPARAWRPHGLSLMVRG